MLNKSGKINIYNKIKIAGMLLFVPFILAAGAISGYFAGSYIKEKFLHSSFTIPISILVGTLASAIEAARIIKLAITLEKK